MYKTQQHASDQDPSHVFNTCYQDSRDSSVSGVTGYRMEEQGSVPDKGKKFSFRSFAHASSRVDTVSY
jgi:hypothetical protein